MKIYFLMVSFITDHPPITDHLSLSADPELLHDPDQHQVSGGGAWLWLLSRSALQSSAL